MKLIIAPINPGNSGPLVANLQDALLALLEPEIIRPLIAPDRPTLEELQKLSALVKGEREQSLFGQFTQELIRYFQVQQGLSDNLRGVVEDTTAAKLNEWLKKLGLLDLSEPDGFVVRGTVKTSDAKPISGAMVHAFDRDMRKEEALGKAETDAQGQYTIRYGLKDFASGDVPSATAPWLIVRAFAGDQQIGTDVTRRPASRDEIVNFEVTAPVLSEWESVSAGVIPLLKGQGDGDQALPSWQINDSDLNFIVEETGLEREKIRLWALAFAIGGEAALATHPEGVNGTDGALTHALLVPIIGGGLSTIAAFYGWFRLGLPTEPAPLWATPTETLLTTLRAAIAQEIVPSSISADLPAVSALIEQIKVDRVLQAPALGTTASLDGLLATLPVPLNLNQRRALAAAMTKLRPDDPELVKHIAAIPGLNDAKFEVARTLRLGALTAGHLPLTQVLQTKSDAERPDSVEFLTALEPTDWIELVFEHGVPPGSGLDHDGYIEHLQVEVEGKFPTQVLRKQLEKQLNENEQFPARKILSFFNANPDFNFRAQSVEPFLIEHGNNDDHLREALLQVQRIHAVTTSARETAQLIDAGFGSAAQIVNEGQPLFEMKMAARLQPEQAAMIFSAAENVLVTVVALGTAYSSLSTSGNAINVLPALPASAKTLNKYPSLRTLFGDLDYCECRHCQSVLGPAAYLADLMHFLQRSPLKPNLTEPLSPENLGHASSYFEAAMLGTVLGALLERRPDLADLELSCENTQTEIPYIDLVLEILENAVGLPMVLGPSEHAGIDIKAAFGRGEVPEAIAQALTKTDIKVGKNLTVTGYPSPTTSRPFDLDNWIIKDGSRRWFVQHVRPQLILWLASAAGNQFLNVTGAARAVGALGQGKLDAEIEDKLSQGLPIAGTPLIQTFIVSTAVQAWIVSYTRAIAIKITMGSSMGAVETLTVEGAKIKSYQWPVGTMQIIVHAFSSGTTSKINSNVAQLLEIPANDLFLQTWNPAKNWWELSNTNAAIIAHVSSLTISGLTYQNSSIREDLKSSPENRNPAAYKKLSEDAVFPWALPFDLWLEETRAFLDALGVPRAKLIDLARPQLRLSDDAAARELLGLSKFETDLIASVIFSTKPWIYWGLEEENNIVKDHTAGLDWGGKWLSVLAHVSMLLQQSGLSYREYLDFRQTKFAGQSKGTLFPPNGCKTSNIAIVGLNETQFTDHLNGIHVFTRLWRKSGWSMRDLDLAISTLGGLVTPTILQDLALVKRLRAEVGLPISALLGCIDKLGTEAWTDHIKEGSPIAPALYDSVFQRQSLRSLTYFDDFSLDKVDKGGSSTTLKLSEHADFVAASLGVKPSQVKAWISGTHTPNLGIADLVELGNLSRLYAAATLCRALSIVPDALPTIVTLLGAAADPFGSMPSPTTPVEIAQQSRLRAHALFEFVDRVGFIRKSGFDFETLSYLLLHKMLPGGAGDGTTKIEQQLTQTLTELRSALQTGAVLGDVSADNLKRQLARLGWYPALIDQAMGSEGLTNQPGASVEISPPQALTPEPLIPLDLRSKFTYQKGSLLFSVGDLKDLAGLVGKFNSAVAPSLSAYLWNQIPTAAQTLVQNLTLGAAQRGSVLVDALNTIAQGVNIYDAARFSAIQLSAETKTLAAQNPTGPDLLRLNGILLAEAYPLEIARNQAVLKCTGSLVASDFTGIASLFPAPKITALKNQYNAQLSAQVKVLAGLMQVFELPKFEEEVTNLTTLPVIPSDLKDRLSFEMTPATKGKLTLTGWLSDTEKLNLSEANPTNPVLSSVGKLHAQALNYVPGLLVPKFITSIDAEQLLREADVEARYRSILLRLVSRLNLDLLLAQLSTALSLDQQVVSRLLDTAKINARSAKELLTDSDFLLSDSKSLVNRKAFSEQFSALELLGKIATIANPLAIRPEQWDWILGRAFSVMDVLALPTSAANTAANFAGWRQLVDLFHLRDVLPDGPARLTRIEAALRPPAPAFDTVRKELAEAFELSAIEVDEVDGACSAAMLDFKGAAPDKDYHNPRRLLELAQLLKVIKSLGTTSIQISQLIQAAPDQSVAQLARELFAASIDAAMWPERLRPISNRLRNLQRDALVAYLVNRDHLADSNDLFDHYLIDVEMGSCMLTSRIKQAISSVQLFVQRCFLNLERSGTSLKPGVSPASIDSQRWQWMKFYRVWEANRNIFLYPENWIEPELRDDKTEIFRAFESDLLQSEITHDTALVAFRKYLDKMADVANLTVVSMFEDQLLNNAETIVHLVGRDNSEPYKHYYRQWKLRPGADFGTWTAWEEISAQVTGDHVLLFVLSGSVYLAWPTISAGHVGNLNWKIGMSLAKRTASGWTKLKKGQGEIQNPMVPYKDERTSLAFRINYIPAATGSTDQTVSIEAFGSPPQAAGETPNETKQESVSDFFDSAAEKFGGAGTSSPVLNLHLRVLDSYVYEYAGKVKQTHYKLATNVKITITATYRYTTPKDYDIIGGWNDPISRTTIYPANSREYSYNGLLGAFIGLKPITWGTPEPGRREFKTLETLASAVKITVTVEKGTSTVTKTLHLSKGNSLNWQEDFIFELKDDPGWLAGSKTLVNAGSFALKDDDSLALNLKPSSWHFLPPPHNFDTEHFISGYREVGESSGLYILQSTLGQSLRVTPGQYFLVRAGSDRPYAPPPIYAYRDDRFSLLFWIHRKTGAGAGYGSIYRVVPFSTGGMRKLTSAIAKGRLLDAVALPIPLTIPPPIPLPPPAATLDPIPLDVTGFGQNYETSVTEVTIDFEKVPTSIYNWEVFFHNPLLIATQLSQAQRFEEAQRWFHLIFDPTTNEPAPAPSTGLHESIRYWRFLPFREAGPGRAIDELLDLLARGGPQADATGLRDNINEWAKTPFRPHMIARHRLRSYQFSVVQKYVENLVAWGDQLFCRDTIESINEATQLYVLVARILGKRPASSPKGKTKPKSYRDIQSRLDSFSNTWIPLEALVGIQIPWQQDTDGGTRQITVEDLHHWGLGDLYFCIPGNEKLSEYWDTVEDRLFKIRHCMNIEGIERQLPLFEPPIDPALLVRTTAAGLDIAAVLSDVQAPLPLYRFNVMVQKALELCSEVRAMGNALLSALEKKDAEEISLLRSGHEIKMLKLVRMIKEQQKDEAAANLEALRKTRELTAQRYLNYQRLMGKQNVVVPAEGTVGTLESSTLQLAPPSAGDADTEGLALISAESSHMGWLNDANNFSLISGSFNALAGILHMIPDFTVGATLPVAAQTKFGGSHLGAGASALGSVLSMLATNASFQAGRSATIGGHQRRFDEWRFQSNTAAKELEQIDKQIIASEIRQQIAEREITNHDQQLKNSQEVDELMRDKYTNQQLYSWMVGQISGVYFSTYQLAHDMAKRAERAYKFELGLSASRFIDFGYWDSLKKGLLSGEGLYHDLKRMDVSYLDQNKREYEITKHVSLLQIDPAALISLRQTGECWVSVPEVLFDLDYPGHYMRRIKSVSITIPCVTGPYTSVNCTLTLHKSSVRKNTSPGTQYARNHENGVPNDDSRFVDNFGLIQSVVTSNAQNDSGLFETNLRDERYLPFEGAGVISTWRVALPVTFSAFDHDSISDVVFHIRYTARDGGDILKQKAADDLQSAINAIESVAKEKGMARLFSLRHDFSTEWHRFTTGDTNANRQQEFAITKDRFPFLLGQRAITISTIDLYVLPKSEATNPTFPELTIKCPKASDATLVSTSGPAHVGQLLTKTLMLDSNAVLVSKKEADATWVFTVPVATNNLKNFQRDIDDILMVCHYRLT